MSSNLGRIPPLILELAALERLKKTTYNLVSTLAPSFLIGSSSFLQVLWTWKFSRDFYFAIFSFSNYSQVLKFASKHSCSRPFLCALCISCERQINVMHRIAAHAVHQLKLEIVFVLLSPQTLLKMVSEISLKFTEISLKFRMKFQ